MLFDTNICDNCIAWAGKQNSCPYRNMNLIQYLQYKKIPFKVVSHEAGSLRIDTSNLMNASAMIELNKEISKSNYRQLDYGWGFKVVCPIYL